MKRIFIIGISLFMICGIAFGLYLNPDAAASIKKQIFGDGEPDLPNIPDFASYKVDKEDFMRRRAEALAAYRGIHKDKPFDPRWRFDAIEKMDQQKAELARVAAPQLAWTEIGPKPIPNGPVETGASTPASGRVIAIAIHPTNPDIAYVGTAQGGLYRTTDGGAIWTQLFNEADSLAVNAIAIAPSDPETVYVGTGESSASADSFFGAGLYRISSASTTATLSGPFGKATTFVGRSISKIVIHPTVSSTIFVTSTSGIGGIGAESNPTLALRGLFRSTDATAATPTFTKLAVATTAGEDRNMYDMVMDPGDATRLLVAVQSTSTTSGVWLTTTALSATPTFTRELVITGTTATTARTELAINRIGGTVTVFAASADAGGTVQRSVDGGDTWTLRIDNDFCTPQCFYDIAVAVSPIDADDVYLGGSPALVFGRSADGGASFTADGDPDITSGLHVDSHVIAVSPSSPSIVYFGSDGGIYKTLDVTATPIVWTSLNNSTFSATQFMGLSVHSTDPNFTIGGTQDNGTNYYDAAGAWLRIDGGDGGYSLIDQTDPGLILVDNYHTYFNAPALMGYAYAPTVVSPVYTFRGCTSAGATTNGITCTGDVLFYAPLEQGPPVGGSLGNTIYYGTTTLYRSTDTGLTHTAASQTFPIPMSAIGIAPTDDAIRLVGSSGGALFGTVTGASLLTDFDSSGVIPPEYISRIVIDPSDSATAYVTLATFGVTNVWKTTTLSPVAGKERSDENVSSTWVAAAGTGMTGLPLVPVNAFVVDPTDSFRLYAGTDIGVYTSPDGGSTWAPFGTGLPKVAVFDMAITPGTPTTRKVRIATHGRGMWEIPAIGPTAATVSVGGRVTNENGVGVSRATVTIISSEGISRNALTSAFGYYRFDDVQVGQNHILQVSSKRYQFQPQVIFVTEDMENVNFTASGSSRFGK
jgi:photosystem II stability/assembly factor-like uncharacterized protein